MWMMQTGCFQGMNHVQKHRGRFTMPTTRGVVNPRVGTFPRKTSLSPKVSQHPDELWQEGMAACGTNRSS